MKKIRNVNTKNLINTVILTLLAILTIFIPFVFKSTSNFCLYYETFPYVGNGTFGELLTEIFLYLVSFLYDLEVDILSKTLNVIAYCIYHLPLILFSVIMLDLLLAILLILIKRNWLRVTFKIISVILGIAMIFVFLLYAYCLTIIILNNYNTIKLVTEKGLFAVFSSTFISLVFLIKQFTWFKKLY